MSVHRAGRHNLYYTRKIWSIAWQFSGIQCAFLLIRSVVVNCAIREEKMLVQFINEFFTHDRKKPYFPSQFRVKTDVTKQIKKMNMKKTSRNKSFRDGIRIFCFCHYSSEEFKYFPYFLHYYFHFTWMIVFENTYISNVSLPHMCVQMMST